jgi:hypothetical protein
MPVETGELILLESCIYTPSGNRRASTSLSPVLVHFVAPQGKLYQRLLLLDPLLGSNPTTPPHQRHVSRKRKAG